jgi:hypothetical protein
MFPERAMNLLTVCMVASLLAAYTGEAGTGADPEAAFQLDEHSPRGTVVGAVADQDSGSRYELLGQDVPGTFAVDSGTGRIVVADPAALDFEQRTRFTLTVRVTTPSAHEDPLWKSFADRLDGEGFGELAEETVVDRRLHVRLVDVNERPVIQDQSFDARSASAGQPLIGRVIASDPDAGDRLSLALEDATDARAFRLDTASGELAFIPEALSRFDGGSAALRVRVIDRGGLASAATVVVELPRAVQTSAVTPDEGPVAAPRPVPPLPRLPSTGRLPTATSDPTSGSTTPEIAGLAGTSVSTATTGSASSGRAAAGRATSSRWAWLWDARRGVSPLALVLACLLGAGAHLIRVRSLRRRWRMRSGQWPVDPVDASAESTAIEAERQELEQQRQALAEVCANVAEDRARLTEEQRQFQFERDELAARHEELSAAEALLAEQRAELEVEQRRFEAQQAQGMQAREKAAADHRPDLYAVDEEHDIACSADEQGRRQGWSNSPVTAGTDPDLATLRANLADMFGTGLANSDIQEAAASPTECAPAAVATAAPADRSSPPGSRESLYRRSPDSPADQPAAGDGESITSYMEALMKRLRQNGGNGPSTTAAPASETSSAPPAVRSLERADSPSTMATAAAPVPASPAVPISPEPRRRPAARPRQSKTEVRDTVNSLREVANLSARSAVARHVRRRRSRRGLLVGLAYVALLAMSTALVTGWKGGSPAGAGQAWVILGAAAVVFLHYVWSTCLADRRHLYRDAHAARKASAKPAERDLERTIAMAQPNPGAGSRAPGAAPASCPERGRAVTDDVPEDETCALAAR